MADAASQAVLIKESFAKVEHAADQVAAHFYAALFLDSPELRDLFPTMMDVQRGRLLHALVRVVQSVDSPVLLERYLGELGYDHRKFGVLAGHYDAVGRALVGAIREFTHDGSFTGEVEEAWIAAYAFLAERMIAGAGAAADRPAWWSADVVRHERVTPEIAVLTLKPELPYDYVPGQYLSLETGRRPRLWRTYSIANAPRPDGTLELHVRAVPGGWVSTALVAHTAAGDTVRLGPPMGSMGVEPGGGPDVLLVAGGTGLAPLKAIVERLAAEGTTRTVHLFVGARAADELYQLDQLMRLSGRHPWLTVVSAVSHDPDHAGRRGWISDVTADHGRWSQHDVYLSGPPAMIRTTIERLRTRQVPLRHIHFDPFGDTP